MNILFLAVDININNKTGDSIHVRELATSLAKLGHKITLITATPLTHTIKSLQAQENLILYFREERGNLSTLSFCGKVIKKHNPDIIYERRFSAKIGATLSKIHKIPLVIEINGLVEEEAKIMGSAIKEFILIKKFKKWMRKRFFKRASRIVTVSEGLKSGLHEQYGVPFEKMVVILNGANIELFKPMDKNKCKKELDLSQEYKYVGFTGHIAPWQGVDQLIKIAPMILEKIPDTRFLIVGDGMIRPEVESLAKELGIEDKIIFTGFILYEMVPKYINTFEVCIAPFSGIERNVKYSFSAIKLYEYMACGKAIVTTDVCGIKREISERGLGRVVKADDLKGLTSSILELLEDQELQIALGEKARGWVHKEHSWKNVAERVIKVCDEVLSNTNLV